MDTNMEDVGRVPTDLPPMPASEPTTIGTLDGWIESLMTCKQLAEPDVQRLCEKVRYLAEHRNIETHTVITHRFPLVAYHSN
jgi:serine/threonine-protein phosphatase 2A catalytic subunit